MDLSTDHRGGLLRPPSLRLSCGGLDVEFVDALQKDTNRPSGQREARTGLCMRSIPRAVNQSPALTSPLLARSLALFLCSTADSVEIYARVLTTRQVVLLLGAMMFPHYVMDVAWLVTWPLSHPADLFVG